MPVIREYDQRFAAPAPGVGPAADPNAALRVGAGAAQLGTAVARTGEVVVDLAERNDHVRLQEELAQARAEFTVKLQRAKETGEAADPEYVKSAYEQAQEKAAALADARQTRRGMEAARVLGAQFASSIQTQAVGDNAFAIGEQAKQAAIQTQNINRNTLRQSPEQFPAILGETLAHLDGPAYSNIDASLRELIKTEAKEGLAVSEIEGYIYERDPAIAKQILDSGERDAFLRAEVKGELYNKLDAEIKERERKAKEEKARQNLADLMRMQEKADLGLLTKRETLNAYDAGIFSTAPQALSFWKHSQDRAKEIERQRVLDVAIGLGDADALVKYTPKEQQEGFDRWAGKLVMEAGDDADARVDAVNRIVTRGRELNQIPSQMRAKLANATVARPAAFVDAAQWYDGLRVVDPVYANAHVPAKQAALFHVFLTATAGGATNQQAIELVRQAGDPEKMQEFQKRMSGSDLEDIENRLDPWIGSAASNSTWARRAVADMAKTRMAFGDSNTDDAVEWAVGQFKSRHALVGGRWLPIQGSASPDLAPALDEYLQRVPDALKKHGATEDDIVPEGYDLRADRQTAIDGSLQLYAKDSGLPIPGFRITPAEAVRAYGQVKKTKAATEAQEAARRLQEIRTAPDYDIDPAP